MIIETCPRCGRDLIDTVLYTYPPRQQKICSWCGWSWTGESTEVKRIPFGGNGYISNNSFGFKSNPCHTCSNNPANGGSGICFCTLGLPEIT